MVQRRSRRASVAPKLCIYALLEPHGDRARTCFRRSKFRIKTTKGTTAIAPEHVSVAEIPCVYCLNHTAIAPEHVSINPELHEHITNGTTAIAPEHVSVARKLHIKATNGTTAISPEHVAFAL